MNEARTDGPVLMMTIPATADAALARVILRHYPAGAIRLYYAGPPVPGERAAGGPPRVVVGDFRFGLHAALDGAAGYVTFLRDPVARVAAMYRQLAGSDDPLRRAAARGGIDRFLAHDWGRNLQTQYLTGLTAAAIDADPEAAYRRAVAVLGRHFLAVGLTERFADSVRLLADRLGWPAARPWVDRVADRPGGPGRGDLDRAVAARVASANRVDARVYGFAARAFAAELERSHADVR
jgi:hypothetical protein